MPTYANDLKIGPMDATHVGSGARDKRRVNSNAQPIHGQVPVERGKPHKQAEVDGVTRERTIITPLKEWRGDTSFVGRRRG